MGTQFVTTAIACALLIVAAPSVADHNSKNGEGTANMPNDIHNTRIETLETNDSATFRDFVKFGEGSKTVNRFESEDTQPAQAAERRGEANAAMKQGESRATNKERVETRTMGQDRSRVETRTRLEPRTSGRMQSDRRATSTRDRGGRKGGRKR